MLEYRCQQVTQTSDLNVDNGGVIDNFPVLGSISIPSSLNEASADSFSSNSCPVMFDKCSGSEG